MVMRQGVESWCWWPDYSVKQELLCAGGDNEMEGKKGEKGG